MAKIVSKKNSKGIKSPYQRPQTLTLFPTKGLFGVLTELCMTSILISTVVMMIVLLIMLAEKITITVGK